MNKVIYLYDFTIKYIYMSLLLLFSAVWMVIFLKIILLKKQLGTWNGVFKLRGGAISIIVAFGLFVVILIASISWIPIIYEMSKEQKALKHNTCSIIEGEVKLINFEQEEYKGNYWSTVIFYRIDFSVEHVSFLNCQQHFSEDVLSAIQGGNAMKIYYTEYLDKIVVLKMEI